MGGGSLRAGEGHFILIKVDKRINEILVVKNFKVMISNIYSTDKKGQTVRTEPETHILKTTQNSDHYYQEKVPGWSISCNWLVSKLYSTSVVEPNAGGG